MQPDACGMTAASFFNYPMADVHMQALNAQIFFYETGPYLIFHLY
jgi:hypothetical protein